MNGRHIFVVVAGFPEWIRAQGEPSAGTENRRTDNR
jgi:hypothetical protein